MSRALSASFCRCSQSGRVLVCCVVHVFRIPCHGSCSLWFFLVLQLILLVLVVLWCRGVSHATFSSHFDSSSILWQSQCPMARWWRFYISISLLALWRLLESRGLQSSLKDRKMIPRCFQLAGQHKFDVKKSPRLCKHQKHIKKALCKLLKWTWQVLGSFSDEAESLIITW